ncbi:hypothetical protein SERLA73DRAFT_75031 [Serpula lacrymans var. lacrymans S7.3]|uniref:Uncharacterized protein n=1 Tax=Serpula lacrymans var. lacrymans (strain S7.3) TaxID=936435 RepID=F8Q2B7_SERL3|nr:hypothetical protein SERLA73DRAFT_75031 [Serpula lacrymans var. lacrymans S7.3]
MVKNSSIRITISPTPTTIARHQLQDLSTANLLPILPDRTRLGDEDEGSAVYVEGQGSFSNHHFEPIVFHHPVISSHLPACPYPPPPLFRNRAHIHPHRTRPAPLLPSSDQAQSPPRLVDFVCSHPLSDSAFQATDVGAPP